MLSSTKVGPRFTVKFFFLIFLGINLFVIAIMIGSLGTKNWVKSNFSSLVLTNTIANGSANSNPNRDFYFDGSIFKGSSVKCIDGCDNSYRTESSDWCGIYDDEKAVVACNLNINCLIYETMCDTFSRLSAGGGVFFVFEIAALIGIFSWSLAMFCSFKNLWCYCFNYCCSVCVCVCHYIATLGWLGITGSQYSDSCGTFPSDGSKIILCNTDGPGLGLFLMIFLPPVVAVFIWIACVAYNKRQFLNNEGMEMSGAPPAVVYQPANNQPQKNPYEISGGNQAPQYVPGPGAPQYSPGPSQYVPGAPQYNPGPPQYNPGPPQYVPAPGAPQYNPGPPQLDPSYNDSSKKAT